MVTIPSLGNGRLKGPTRISQTECSASSTSLVSIQACSAVHLNTCNPIGSHRRISPSPPAPLPPASSLLGERGDRPILMRPLHRPKEDVWYPEIRSVSGTRDRRPRSASPLAFIFPSRNLRANGPSTKKRMGHLMPGRTRRSLAIANCQPHGGKLRKGGDRLSGRNSSMT